MVDESNIQVLNVFFVLEPGKISFYREKNKPEHAQPIVAIRMDDTDDGWSHAWFFNIQELATLHNPMGWHFQFDGVTFDKTLSDAVMNNIKFDGDTRITPENSGSDVVFAELAFVKHPFGELAYSFEELPVGVRSLYKQLVIAATLKEHGWTLCVDEAAAAKKSFETAVGVKTAFAYVHSYLASDGSYVCKLSGEYQSEGRNILSAETEFFSETTSPKKCAGLTAEFLADVDNVIRESYAVKLFAPAMA